jgi:hypothetical protein
MEYISTHFIEIMAIAGSIVAAFLALKQKSEDMQYKHFEERIAKLSADVDVLKKDTVRVDYLKRIDEDIDDLRTIVQQTREEFVKKSDLKETEYRIIEALSALEKRVSETMNKKVDIANCKLIHGKQ